MSSLSERDLLCLVHQLRAELAQARAESALRLDRCERLKSDCERLHARVAKLEWRVARLKGRDRWHQRRVRDAVDTARYLHGVALAAGVKFPERQIAPTRTSTRTQRGPGLTAKEGTA